MRVRLSTLVAVLVLAIGAVAPRARAEQLTFQFSARQVLASVDRFNALVASLGKRAKGVRLIPGGTRFAGQTCAGFGDTYRLAAVTILDGSAALADLVPSRRGRDAAALQSVFEIAHVARWNTPVLGAETSVPFWTADPTQPHGVRFAAEGVTHGGDAGFITAADAPGELRLRADVASPPDPAGLYRFLIAIEGRRTGTGASVSSFPEQRCFAFLELAPVDLSQLLRFAKQIVRSPQRLATLQLQLVEVEGAIDRADLTAALNGLATFTALVASWVPEAISPAGARRLATAAFNVRRGLFFTPLTSQCGNGTRETGEQCDGSDLGGYTCSRLNFADGTLACGSACRFDTSGCIGLPVCGNGILEPPEECDHGSANSDTAPDACRKNCKRPFCGDGVIDSIEDCDGNKLDGETCKTLGYDGGTLRCDPVECFFDDERCIVGDF